MVKRILTICLAGCGLLAASSAHAVTFRWAVEKGVTYKVISYVYEEKYRNSKLHSIVDIRNKALLKAINVASNAAEYAGDFYYYERKLGATNTPFALKQVYPTRFWRDELGRYQISDKYYMPVVRGVPTFPTNDIKPGAMWRAPGEEVHDLKHYGIKGAYRIPIDARYIYVGDEMVDGRRCAKFSITYIFTHLGKVKLQQFVKRANRLLRKYRRQPRLYRRYKQILQQKLSMMQAAPKRISGSLIQLYYWDIEARLPLRMSEDFHFVFHLFNNEVHEYKGHSMAEFRKVVPLEKQKRDRLVRKLKQDKADGVTVKKDKRGVVVNLGDILFDFNKASLRPEARRRLQKLAQVLDQYQGRDIRVEGHTDSSGDADYNLKLSQRRARTVAQFLSRLLKRDPRRISWIGYGKSRPVAPNSTKQGRAKNRRVEIIILTNE